MGEPCGLTTSGAMATMQRPEMEEEEQQQQAVVQYF